MDLVLAMHLQCMFDLSLCLYYDLYGEMHCSVAQPAQPAQPVQPIQPAQPSMHCCDNGRVFTNVKNVYKTEP